MNNSFLTQKVNFTISVLFMGSAALLAIVLMLQAAEMENPLVDQFVVLAAEDL